MDIHDSFTLRRNDRTTVVELVKGDLTNNLPGDWKVDLLLVSAFPDSYQETFSSVIGALGWNQDIHVGEDLATDKDEDLRDTLECWISKPLPETKPYRRIMVWEPWFLVDNIVKEVESIFAAIIAMAKNTRTLAMPILAAGDQGSNKIQMLEAILYATQKWVIHRGLPIEKISIFMYTYDERVTEQFRITKNILVEKSHHHHQQQQSEKEKEMEHKQKEEETVDDSEEEEDQEVTIIQQPDNHHPQQPTTIFLSFAPCDQWIADRIGKAIELIDNEINVEKLDSSTFDTQDITQKESSNRNLASVSSKVISILTPGYIRDLGCLDYFNECYLNETNQNLLAPILVEDTEGLPNYIRMIQCHDVRPNCCIGKLFSALVNIVESVSSSSKIASSGNSAKTDKISTTTPTTTTTTTGNSKRKSSWNKNDTKGEDELLSPVIQEQQQQQQPTYDVFISYSTKLSAQAKAIYEILLYLQPNLRIFFDSKELHVGIRWQQQIYQSLDNSRVVLFVLTPDFVASPFCNEEAAIASLRARENRLRGIVSLEAIPLSPKEKSLPREVVAAVVPNETPFQACQRVISLLQFSSTDLREQQPLFLETRHIMHRRKEAEIEHATQEWRKELHPTAINDNVAPKICIIGHENMTEIMSAVRDQLKLALPYPGGDGEETNTNIKIVTGPGGDRNDEVIKSIDTANIIICILSEQFVCESVFMDVLNVGLLRNRSDGGCLIPIMNEALFDIQQSCELILPSYIRLMPAIDGSFLHRTSVSLLTEKIAAMAKLATLGKWNSHTTIVALDED